MAALYDLVIMTVSSAFGTSSNIPLSAAATVNGVSYLSFASAGTPANQTVAYSILDTGASEIGTAVYLSSGPLLGTRTPTFSTNANAAITASSAALIVCGPRAEDIISTDVSQTFTSAQQTQARANIAAIGAAAKSDQVTGTSTSLGATPAVQQFHASAAKAWAYVTASGTTYTTQSSYGISGIVRNSAGNLTVTFSAAFTSSSNMAGSVTPAAGALGYASFVVASTNTGTITLFNVTPAAADFGFVLSVFGTQ